MEFQQIVTWVKAHWPIIVGVLGASTGIISLILAWIKLRWQGSRRSSRNWARTLELVGDTKKWKLLVRRLNPDTIDCEGDAASTYAAEEVGMYHMVVDGVLYTFRRHYVLMLCCFYQWETVRGLGDNLMQQTISEPLPGMGLKEQNDGKGNSFWVTVPKEDELVSAVHLPKPQDAATAKPAS